MTAPSPETLERERDTLFVTEAQLIRRLGIPERDARPLIQMLDAQHTRTGFPQPCELWKGRRYWPAIKEWFDRNYMVRPQAYKKSA